jgi:iron complex outermembrane receptor protein
MSSNYSAEKYFTRAIDIFLGRDRDANAIKLRLVYRDGSKLFESFGIGEHPMKAALVVRKASISAIALIGVAWGYSAHAQESVEPQAETVDASDAGEIVVTATKGRNAQSVHKAPLTVTAFGAQQLARANVESISDLTKMVPNVVLNDNAAVQGINNFSIRGMSVYSSVPSTTPTVGIFVDGVFVGASAGSAMKAMFDLDGVEVLRGPQGVLFGRNVTAGAILLRTTEPTDDLKIQARLSAESGLNKTGSVSVSGPLTSGGELSGKLAVYHNNDAGWFTNEFDKNDHFGQSTTTIGRAALKWSPSSEFTTVLRAEDGRFRSDGPASQNRAVYDRDSFRFSVNETGYNNIDWTNVTSESRLDVGFGDGQIVNIAGWRTVKSDALSDIDATPSTLFHLREKTRQEQFSNELRYAGTFGPVSITAGGFYYWENLKYNESRNLPGGVFRIGGGQMDSRTWAVFSNLDFKLTETLTVNAGGRYSRETKDAKVQVLGDAATSPCSFITTTCSSYNFSGKRSWNSFSPKVGFQWQPSNDTHVYGFWTRGFRSGGFNLRQTVLTSSPGPYDQEKVDSLELGWKQYALDRKLNLGVAVFRNKYKNLQRDVAITNAAVGVVQTTLNTADTTITGVEVEATLRPTDELTLRANGGFLHNKWDRFIVGLASPTGVPTPADFNLELPFLAPWSYGASVDYAIPTSFGKISFGASYQHIDPAQSEDRNIYRLNPTDNIDANISLEYGDHLTASIYAKNLLDQARTGLVQSLPFAPGQTFAPLGKGRVFGASISYSY